ncbi:MAG: DsbA family protein [Chloroflexaceae bacterium]|jgi:predicted DsbA family dithiol-disulfide isomerase|nr:DsbA family protein [Chloroflexaceae bacterium]
MSAQPISITFYFDYLCPFAYRTVQWISQVQEQLGDGLSVNWKYFSLEQINTPADSDWKVWEQDEGYTRPNGSPEYRSLLAFWAAEAVRQQGPALFLRFHHALYHARHRDKLDFANREGIAAVAASVGVDMERFNQDFHDRGMLEALRESHEQARAQYQAFGVPTICFDAENAIYLKLMEVPPADDAVALFHELHQSITARRWLAEVKRPNP